jgi:hypothetical protein
MAQNALTWGSAILCRQFRLERPVYEKNGGRVADRQLPGSISAPLANLLPSGGEFAPSSDLAQLGLWGGSRIASIESRTWPIASETRNTERVSVHATRVCSRSVACMATTSVARVSRRPAPRALHRRIEAGEN